MLVHVPGIAVIGGSPGAVLDDRTGEVLWTVPSGEQLTATSDRELVLLQSPSTDELVVRDLRTGHEVLRYPAPGTAGHRPGGGQVLGCGCRAWSRPADGILLVGTAGGVAALGP